MDAIDSFVKLFANTNYEGIPAPAVAAVRQEVLDSLATALGGRDQKGLRELVDVVKEWGGTEQSTVIGYGLRCPAPHAAQVNGTMTHALDYDDGHPVAQVHIGCVTVPTAFAVAERMGGISGKEFVTTLALGADFLARLGLASRPHGSLIKSGWHPTPSFGYLGAAAVAGRLMALDEERTTNALGIAYHQCAGNSQAVNDGVLTKRMGPGLAARGGITAALMAERGITGARNILEGEYGLFNLYHGGDYDVDILTGELGKRFEVVNLGDKPYPCCGFSHPFIDAVLSLKAKHDIQPGQVKEIRAWCGETSYEISQPPEVKTNPRNTIDAQFSLQWAIATALVKGKVSVEDFTEEAIKNQPVLDTAAKVTAEHDSAMDRHGVGPGRLKIIMDDGTTYEEYVEHCLGSVERPMTFEDCTRKFRECAAGTLSAETMDTAIDLISRLETLDDATEIIRLLG
ncbi:MAG: MmgE/PrpD family protein [Dehalococcoidales bacterium]|nr:MmgE/PrpD family protein [Dehalococcoidales bacterium]